MSAALDEVCRVLELDDDSSAKEIVAKSQILPADSKKMNTSIIPHAPVGRYEPGSSNRNRALSYRAASADKTSIFLFGHAVGIACHSLDKFAI